MFRRILVLLLFLGLAACAQSGTRSSAVWAGGEGWRSTEIDEETELWERVDTPRPVTAQPVTARPAAPQSVPVQPRPQYGTRSAPPPPPPPPTVPLPRR